MSPRDPAPVACALVAAASWSRPAPRGTCARAAGFMGSTVCRCRC